MARQWQYWVPAATRGAAAASTVSTCPSRNEERATSPTSRGVAAADRTRPPGIWRLQAVVAFVTSLLEDLERLGVSRGTRGSRLGALARRDGGLQTQAQQ
jgi:hypothetical protein